MFVEVGKGEISPTFVQVLELLVAKDEYLAFAPDTNDMRMMIDILSLKFPLLKVRTVLLCLLFFAYTFSSSVFQP